VKTVTIECLNETCPNQLVLHGDDYMLKTWICPACEEALEHQRVLSLAARYENRQQEDRVEAALES
jgi:hypothetical protein